MATSRGKEKGAIVHSDKVALVRDQIRDVMVEERRRENGEILSVLDALRRTRAARGGVGAPLAVPAHLRAGTELIITDADLKLPESREEAKDTLSGLGRRK